MLTAALAPGAAQAAPTTNDDFVGATAITSLPFSSTVDTSDGTATDDNPADNERVVETTVVAAR